MKLLNKKYFREIVVTSLKDTLKYSFSTKMHFQKPIILPANIFWNVDNKSCDSYFERF